jgi:hypothetical protein
MKPPRYRLGLIWPCFELKPTDLRPLTVKELDQLANMLRGTEAALREYDAAAAGVLDEISHIDEPWWPELRPELLRKGFPAHDLDENVGSCSGADWWCRVRHADDPPGNRRQPPRWFAPLVADIVQRVEITPLHATITKHIRTIAEIDVGKLDAAMRVVCVFHPFGSPHQIELANFAELWGMKPIHKTDDGHTLIGYGEEGPPKKLPWQTGEVKAQFREKRPEGPDEDFWQSSYEGLLSWVAELLVVLNDRISDIADAHEKIDHLLYEVNFLAGLDNVRTLSRHSELSDLGMSLRICRRLLSGLLQEIEHPRDELIVNLRSVTSCFGATWREPLPADLNCFKYELEGNV